jgi:hypothetical protein
MDILIIILSIAVIIAYRSLQLGITASGSRFNRSITSEVKSREVIYDLKIPLYFLLCIVLIKITYNYLHPLMSFNLLDTAPIWIVKINNTIYSFIQNIHLSKWTETIIEYLLVIGTYFIIIITKAIKKNKIQFDNLHWDEYEEKLQKAKRVKALNLSLIEEFFEPMGFRYFLDQIIELKMRTNGEPLTIDRLVIIADGEKLHDSWIMNYNPSSNEMNKEYRMFHNFIELHKIHGINLYFATKTEILDFAKDNNLKINARKTFVEWVPFRIYFILMITFILPLVYFTVFLLNKFWHLIEKISHLPTFINDFSNRSPFPKFIVWIFACLSIILPVIYGIASLIRWAWGKISNIKAIKNWLTDLASTPIKDLDLLNIEYTTQEPSGFYSPRPDNTGTILNFTPITDTNLIDLANKIIEKFSEEQREVKVLFDFNH